jgi:prefoldin subunit 5
MKVTDDESKLRAEMKVLDQRIAALERWQDCLRNDLADLAGRIELLQNKAGL